MMIRGIIESVSGGIVRLISATGRVGESFAKREFFQHYGFASRPKPGAEHVTLIAGNMLITIASDDRRYRIELAEGEVCIHDDLGQKVHLTRDGIVIKTDQKVTIDAPLLDVSGDITSGGNISDSTRSMAADRQIYDGHNHIAAGSITSPPQQPE